MVLPRVVLIAVAPGYLIRRDTRAVHDVIDAHPRRCIQGSSIANRTRIPDYQLKMMLQDLETAEYIERDPGPCDQPYTRDVFAAWWCPGRRWDEMPKIYGDEV